MPYQTGTANNMADLRAQMSTFLVGNGWTDEAGAIFKKASAYGGEEINAWVRTGESGTSLEVTGGEGSDGGGNLTQQMGWADGSNWLGNRARMCSIWGVSANVWDWPIVYNFHLTTTPVNEFWCFVNHNSIYWSRIGFGEVAKLADFTGGPFVSGCWNSFTPIPQDARSFTTPLNNIVQPGQEFETIPFAGCIPVTALTSQPNWFGGSAAWAEVADLSWVTGMWTDGVNGPFAAGKISLSNSHVLEERQRAESDFNGNLTLSTIRPALLDPDENYIIPFYLHSIRFTKNGSLNPGDVVDISPDKWKIYPCFAKDAANPDPEPSSKHSGTYALAVLYDGP